jgi:hypothetical protein
MFYNGSGSNQIVSPLPVNDGRLHHLAVSYDGAVETVYLDGVRLPPITTTQLALGAMVLHYQLGTGFTYFWTWGGTGSDGWFPFNGVLRDAHVYDHALALADVLSIYFAAGAGFCPALTTPAITWPAPADISVGTPLSSTQLNAAAMADGSSIAGSFVYTPAAGTVLTEGAHTLSTTFTPDDATRYAQTTATVSITVLARPRSAPHIDTAPDMSIVGTSSAGAAVTFATPVATDSVDAAVPVACAPASGATFTIGATTVTCTATNTAGLTASSSFTVTVLPPTIAIDVLEHVTVTDSIAVLPSAMITVAEHVSVTDSVMVRPSVMLNITEIVHVADSPAAAPVDTDPPVITFPASIVADATSPAGAAVEFLVIAKDAVDGFVTPLCSPASNSTFAIGDTAVRCTARDRAGNSAVVVFRVTVRSAEEQTKSLLAMVDATSFQQGSSTLQAAMASLSRGSTASACGEINAFMNQVSAQSGKKLTAAQAKEWLDAAARIRAALGC